MSASPRATSATAEDRPAAESAQAPDPAATRPGDPRTTTRLTVLLISGVALAGVSLVSLGQGSVTVSGGEVWTALFGSPQSAAAETTVGTTIVWTLRLPRLILGMLIGSSLALAGTVLQAILRNPLADPGIIGVSAGGGLIAVILLILFPHMTGWLPLGATLGGLGVALLIYGIAWKDGTIFPLRVILAGVALNTALASLMSLLMLLYSERVPAVLPWLAGTLSGRSWPQVGLLWPYACAAGLPVFFCARQLNLLLLGEEQAAALGLPVTLTRLGLSALAAGLAAGVVSVAGLIGFVGLVVPHLCRLLVGADHRFLLPTAALVGAGLVVTADLSARTLFARLRFRSACCWPCWARRTFCGYCGEDYDRYGAADGQRAARRVWPANGPARCVAVHPSRRDRVPAGPERLGQIDPAQGAHRPDSQPAGRHRAVG